MYVSPSEYSSPKRIGPIISLPFYSQVRQQKQGIKYMKQISDFLLLLGVAPTRIGDYPLSSSFSVVFALTRSSANLCRITYKPDNEMKKITL